MLQFIKTKNVKTPARASEFESGIDFFVPEDLTEVKITPSLTHTGVEKGSRVFSDKGELVLHPLEGALIPAGIKMIVPAGYDLVFDNKSGIASKHHLIIGAKVIDSSYRGEVHLHLINCSNETQVITLGQKLVQGIIRKVETWIPQEISEEEFLEKSDTVRGEGGFGSTGTK